MPDQSPLHRWAQLLQPATLHRVLDHLVHLAWQLQVTQGRTRRLDGTVVETNIHHPTASTLLHDGVRVLSRALGQAQRLLRHGATLPQEMVTDCTQQARAQMTRIMAVARQQGEDAAERLKTTYRTLIHLTTTVGTRAQYVQATLVAQATASAHRGAARIAQYVPRVEQVIAQTTRRVWQGEQVPASEKIVRLFAPDTAIIRQGKPGQPTECGRCVWLDEVAGGIISRYAGLDGNLAETAQRPPSLEHPLQQCGHPPTLLTGARGVHSATTDRSAQRHGVAEVVLPTPGKKSAKRLAYERQEWFRAGRNGRADIEGRISGLQRRHGLDRCRSPGTAGRERWVGLGVLAQHLAA